VVGSGLVLFAVALVFEKIRFPKRRVIAAKPVELAS
jgi:hypothetical protein